MLPLLQVLQLNSKGAEGAGISFSHKPRLLIQRQHVNNYEILELAMCLTAFLW